jgi:hypothetical protein
LSSRAAEGPYASLVAFAATDDLQRILFATPRVTRKFANLMGEPRVALLIDNRSNHEADFHEAMAATAIGAATEVAEDERASLESCYLAKHPHLREFLASPSCAFFTVRVERYIVVRRFQEVMELHVPE